MNIHPTKPGNYSEVDPSAIAYNIQVMAACIAEKVNGCNGLEKAANRKILAQCNKTQLKAIAAELDTVQKRIKWIIDGRY